MGLLICMDALQETFHPQLSIGVCWTRTHTIELANFRAKHLDRWVVLMHDRRKLDKVIHIFCNRESLSCVWIDKSIWLIADRPEFDWMEGSISIVSSAEAAMPIIHVIDPVARQCGSVLQE